MGREAEGVWGWNGCGKFGGRVGGRGWKLVGKARQQDLCAVFWDRSHREMV